MAAPPRHLGAEVSFLLLVHTWGQNLHHHPHVHGIVTVGGLSCDATGRVHETPRWLSCRPGFFLPVRVLSRVYRGKFVAGLRAAFGRGHLEGSHAAQPANQDWFDAGGCVQDPGPPSARAGSRVHCSAFTGTAWT